MHKCTNAHKDFILKILNYQVKFNQTNRTKPKQHPKKNPNLLGLHHNITRYKYQSHPYAHANKKEWYKNGVLWGDIGQAVCQPQSWVVK